MVAITSPLPAGGIVELSLLEDLEEISQRYKAQFGSPPVNLSHWDQCEGLKRLINIQVPEPEQHAAIDYAFSYTRPELFPVLERLGFNSAIWGGLLTHSGSTAIVAAAHWLKMQSRKHVLVVGPRYFTVPYAFEALGLKLHMTHCRRQDGGYTLPADLEQHAQSYDALWITNPVYCTSLYYSSEEVERLLGIASRGVAIVLDECLCEPGHQLGPAFNSDAEVAAIYAPHKTICVNGMKFAALALPKRWQGAIDAWADVWLGCLPFSSVLGIRHFLGSDFIRYQAEFRSECARRFEAVCEIVNGYGSLSVDFNAEGYLISVYAPGIHAVAGIDVKFLERCTFETGALFIAGIRNELDPGAGLSFRVNLAACDAAALGALHRLCLFLDREVAGISSGESST